MKLNLGCGSRAPEGWVNVDYSLGSRMMKVPGFKAINRHFRFFNIDWDKRIVVHDLTKRFPWADGIADAIYTSHTLEHFVREDGLRFLSECHRVLRRGGILRIVVPDLYRFVQCYIEGHLRADQFVEDLRVLSDKSGNPLKDRLRPLIDFPHKCMYDTKTLLHLLREAGIDAKARDPFDSDLDDIRQIELCDRTVDAVIVEGCKP